LTLFEIPTNRVFIIAELANAHTGSLKKLKKLIKKTIETKTDAIKFPFFKTEELLVPKHPNFKLFKSLEFLDSEWKNIFKILKKNKITICVDVFSINRTKFANKIGTDVFKIHSSDINNENLLKFVASTNKPILLSCSGCEINEIDNAVNLIKKNGNSQIILMHGFAGFPTKISDINLRRISALKDRYDLPIGYSDHVDGGSELALYLPLIGLGLGANVIEKHITLNRELKEEDYESSINPDEFASFVKIMRKASKGLGKSSFNIGGSEIDYRKIVKRVPVSKKYLKKSHKLKNSDISLKRVHNYHEDVYTEKIVNGITKNQIKKNMELNKKNVKITKVKTIATLACRTGSSRLFAKPLQTIGNKTILETQIIQLKKSKLIDDIVLAISENSGNEVFVDFARKNNLKFIRGDDKDVQQRIIDAAKLVKADIIFRVTTEDPFVYWEIIDDAIRQHIHTKVDFTFTPNLPAGMGFELINLQALEKAHRFGNKRTRSEAVTEYFHLHRNQFKFKPFQINPKFRRPDIRLTVDNPEDLILVRKIAAELSLNKKIPKLENILRLLKQKPELLEINKEFVELEYRTWL